MPELYSQCSRSIMFQMHFQWNKLSPYGSCTVWNSCVQRHPKIQLQLVHSCNMRLSKAQTKDVFIHSPRHIIDLPPSPPMGHCANCWIKKPWLHFNRMWASWIPVLPPIEADTEKGIVQGHNTRQVLIYSLVSVFVITMKIMLTFQTASLAPNCCTGLIQSVKVWFKVFSNLGPGPWSGPWQTRGTFALCHHSHKCGA